MPVQKKIIIAADKAFSELSVAKGSNAAFLAYMADDARIFGTGKRGADSLAEPKQRNDFRQAATGDPTLDVLSWVPDNVEVSDDDTVGYSDGRWLFEGKPDAKGNRQNLTGHYVTVWRKVGSEWKFVADIGTTDVQTDQMITGGVASSMITCMI